MALHTVSAVSRLLRLLPCRAVHTSAPCQEVIKLTRLRVVDNSDIGKQAMAEGRPPKIIHVYNKTGVGKLGNIFLYAYCTMVHV